MRVIRPGDEGPDVRDLQHRLAGLGFPIPSGELGRFGPFTEAAVRGFQAERRLPADGLVGRDTWTALVEATFSLGDRTLYLREPSFRGDDVRELQRLLNALGFDAGKEDGIFGPATDAAVREFQRNVGRVPDGIVGPETLTAVQRLRPQVNGPSRAVVREEEEVRALVGQIGGARIAIDPGHGPSDPGYEGAAGTLEADVTLALARALAGELSRRGAIPTLLRDDDDPDPSARARAANDLGAVLCVSIHCGGEREARPGASCSYFATGTTHSPGGRRLAELVHRELTDGLGLADRGTHPLAVAMLRETRMTAVQVEPGCLSHPDDERLLTDPAFHRRVAAAIADGLERFLAPASREGAPAPGR
ncbi:MAG TPA: peptidoglycan-binding protein [Actinomycetota bacterium]|nr:peptidoglycan-binding protein [Actinomycetota bacterium]